MSATHEQVNALNQILAIIDEKAALYKRDRLSLRPAQAAADKKLVLDLISDALTLAEGILPRPSSAITDLQKLRNQIG